MAGMWQIPTWCPRERKATWVDLPVAVNTPYAEEKQGICFSVIGVLSTPRDIVRMISVQRQSLLGKQREIKQKEKKLQPSLGKSAVT